MCGQISVQSFGHHLLLKAVVIWLIPNFTWAINNPSRGCEKEMPESLNPGQTIQFNVTYNDKYLGAIPRLYHMQLPRDYFALNNVSVPIVFDLHGFTESSVKQSTRPWKHVGLDNNFIVVWPHGHDDGIEGRGSFNCSKTDGPLGPPCDPNRKKWGEIECYPSCPNCNPQNSCDWSSCADDIGFIEFIIEQVTTQWCVDLDQMHITGYSNGGMFAYYLASHFPSNLSFASMNPVAASPLIGFGTPPLMPYQQPIVDISIIDFHGLLDSVIPYNHETSGGLGPHNSLISYDGYYYEDKRSILDKWARAMHCMETEEEYQTDFDGIGGMKMESWADRKVGGFKCWIRRCAFDNALVRCTGAYGHEYPLIEHSNRAAAEIAWKFMKEHPRKPTFC